MWDIFISYASEDKETTAKPLASLLCSAGLSVWFDENELKVGDSLRAKIDEGLSQSRYGVVILSNKFFEKKWTQRELGGLLSQEVNNRKVILPILDNISPEIVAKYSPILADKISISTDKGLDKVASEIFEVVTQISFDFNYDFGYCHNEIITCCDFNTNNKWLVTGDEEGVIIVCNLLNQETNKIQTKHIYGNGINLIRFSPDGSYLVSGGYGGENKGGKIVIWEGNTLQELSILTEHLGERIKYLHITRNNILVSASPSKVVITDLIQQSIIQIIDSRFSSFAVMNDNLLMLMVGKYHNTIHINYDTGEFSETGLMDEGTIYVYDIFTNNIIRKVECLSSNPVLRIATDDSTGKLIALLESEKIVIIDYKTFSIEKEISLNIFPQFKSSCGAHILGGIIDFFSVIRNIILISYRGNNFFLNYKESKYVPLRHQGATSISINKDSNKLAIFGIMEQGLDNGEILNKHAVNIYSARIKVSP